ncbi:hypothetical protein AB0O47_39490, partial [Streptomyces noursei]
WFFQAVTLENQVVGVSGEGVWGTRAVAGGVSPGNRPDRPAPAGVPSGSGLWALAVVGRVLAARLLLAATLRRHGISFLIAE